MEESLCTKCGQRLGANILIEGKNISLALCMACHAEGMRSLYARVAGLADASPMAGIALERTKWSEGDP